MSGQVGKESPVQAGPEILRLRNRRLAAALIVFAAALFLGSILFVALGR